MENSNIPLPSAPVAVELDLSVFLGAYEAAKTRWSEQQRELASNPSATQTDRTILVDQQTEELRTLIEFFRVSDDTPYVVPFDWGDGDAHPRLQGLTNTIVGQLSKHGILKPFVKGGDVDFGRWKEKTLRRLKVLAVDNEGYNLVNQLCMSLIEAFIPEQSAATLHLERALAKRVDSNGRLLNGLLLPDLLQEIWLDMRSSQVNRKVQLLAKTPKWITGKDTVVQFNRRYDDYLRKRLGVQNVADYLDKNPALRREYYMNYQSCMPVEYRKEIKFDIHRDLAWIDFLKLFEQEEGFQESFEDTGKNDKLPRFKVKGSINNHKGKQYSVNKNRNFNGKRNGLKKRFKNNKTKYNTQNGYTNNRQSFVPNNGYNNNNIVPYNKKGFNEVNPRNTQRVIPSNVANSGNKSTVHGRGRAIKPVNRGPQVNALNIDSLTDNICTKLQDMFLTAKMSTLIAICLLFLCITPVSGQSTIPEFYPWEKCDAPRIPMFYRLTDTQLNSAMPRAVTLTPIDEECEPDTNREPIIGFEIDKLVVSLVGTAPKLPKEYKHSPAILTKCNPAEVVLVNDKYYTRIEDEDESAIIDLDLNIGFVQDVRKEFLLKCPDWDNTKSEDTDIDDGTETASEGEKDTSLTYPSTGSVFDKFNHSGKISCRSGCRLQRNENNGYEFETNAKRFRKERDGLENSCKAASDKIAQDAQVLSKQKENESEISRLRSEIALLKQDQIKMIQRTTYDTDIAQLKTKLDYEQTNRQTIEKEKKEADEKNQQLEKDKLRLEGQLKTCNNDLSIVKNDLKAKQAELDLLSSAPKEEIVQTDFSLELQTCQKLLSEVKTEKSDIESSLKRQYSNAETLLKEEIVDLTSKTRNLNTVIRRVKYNVDFIIKEIRNIYHKPDGVTCIIRKALENRLKSITSFMAGNTRLEYKQPEEVIAMKTNLKAVENSPHYTSYLDITKKLNTVVKDIDLNPSGQDYESLLTFFGGVITTIVGRIVKEKIGDYLSRRNNNTDSNNTQLNTFSSLGVPTINSPASRITTTPVRGVLVNRHGRIGETVNSILTPLPPNSSHTAWNPNITITMNDELYEALIDTGATINVISRKLRDKLALPMEASTLRITTANGDITSTIGRVQNRTVIMGNAHMLTYDVMENCSHDLILGLPAIKQVGVKTLFSKDVTIPANSCNIIHARVSPDIHSKNDVILDLHSYWKNADQILTFEQVCSINDSMVPLVLVNAGRNPVKLHKDTHIGMVHTIEELDDNTLLVNSEEVVPDDADWEETLPPYSDDMTPLDKTSFIKLIDLSNTLLTENEKKILLDILWEFRTAFHEYDGQPGLYTGRQRLNIKLKTTEVPRRIKPSRMSIEKEREISKQIADMLRTGMIEPSRSPYLSRVVLVRKKDQKWRFVVDFRGINTLIEQQTHVIPRIDKITEDAAGRRYYTSFDLKAGFHQIPLDENSRRIAAFITHDGVFQYKVMPMGLTGSPDKFQEVMDEVLQNIPNCYVYLDDILTCADNVTTHLQNISEILDRICIFGMKISIAKRQFAQPSAHYLGFVLDNKGIHPNPDKVKAINDKPIPRTYKEVKSFLGAASYFRRHIRNFSAIAEPLYKLDKNFEWTDIHDNAFTKLKEALINATTLSPPDNTKNYTIFTDASFQDLGAALVQQDKPIAFASRSLKPAEKNYPIIKLEALGLIYALKQFRPYIYGKHTLVITDHKPLLALLKNKELTGILQRYQMAIMEYDLTIQYIKGDANNVADYLSRDSFLAINVKDGLLDEVFPTNGHPPYHIDKFLQYYDEKETEAIPKTGKIRTPSGTRIYVPQQLREKLLEIFHTHPLLGGHLSFDKMNGRFKRIFYWPKMDTDMMTNWQSCLCDIIN
uniref:RNA-directed DNA polymerase n=1 Tax=Strongyloides papillosus TaxID=174720 RepID=A0A0N5C294_STREA